MTSRRKFIEKIALTAGSYSLSVFHGNNGEELMQEIFSFTSFQEDNDQDFWELIKQAYTVSPHIINLNNGGVSPSPQAVQQAVERYNNLSNEAPSYYMWRILDQGREPLRRNLARLAGCSEEEIAIQRNATEALEAVIFGLPLGAGDEIVATVYDYPNMINAWKQRENREGVVVRWLDFKMPIEDPAELVELFVDVFNSRTKVVHITHMINWTGQILPVKAIAAEAHKRGIEVLVDGAHTFAHLDFDIPDLDCDYFGTSLHKWLCAPFGSGMLYVRKNKIGNLFPLFGAPDPQSEDIRKFEHLGTRSFAIEQAIGQAIDFQYLIGKERKERRLRYLKNYWLEECKEKVAGLTSYTPENEALSCALANIAVEGKDSDDLAQYLFREFKIHTSRIVWEGVDGVRITPHVYTLERDLDVLIEALIKFSKL